jgi:protein-S-isoprenylcysteine O-methyltransferase Ste14
MTRRRPTLRLPRPSRCSRSKPADIEVDAPGQRRDRWIRLGYGGLLGFFVLEGAFRRSGNASSLGASAEDRGTTRVIIVAYAIAAGLPLLTRQRSARRLPFAFAPAGLVVQAVGLAVRAEAMRTLGDSYTRTLRIEDDQARVVRTGPYRLVRHPGYLGSMLTWTGFALTSRNSLTVALVSGPLGAAYGRRIRAEEELLRRDLADYAQYAQNTKRLIPLVW